MTITHVRSEIDAPENGYYKGDIMPVFSINDRFFGFTPSEGGELYGLTEWFGKIYTPLCAVTVFVPPDLGMNTFKDIRNRLALCDDIALVNQSAETLIQVYGKVKND
jgi:hypothetical protein